MPGLIESQMPDPTKVNVMGNDVATAGTTTVDPTTRTVNTNETVAGQLDSLLKADSPLMTTARTSAKQYANSRGLINSTMAAQAGEQAAINTALPIAQQDASVFGQASKDNMDATNNALQFNAGSKNQNAQFNVNTQNQFTKSVQDTGLQKEIITAQGEQQKQLQASGAAFEKALQQVRGEQATGLANIEANYRSLIQASASAQTFFTAMANNISAVLANTDTSAEQKQAAVDKITQMMNGGLTVIGSISNLDLAGLLDFSGA